MAVPSISNIDLWGYATSTIIIIIIIIVLIIIVKKANFTL
jgi:hypothetical protein